MIRLRPLVTTVASSVIVLSACSALDGGSDLEPTITQEQAENTVEGNFRDILAALENPPEPERQYLDTTFCPGDRSDDGSVGRKFISLSYALRNLSQTRYRDYFDQAKAYWQNNGWRIRSDSRPQDDFIGVDDPDGRFGMSIQGNDKGNVFIASTSPCIWPDGTPPPSVTE